MWFLKRKIGKCHFLQIIGQGGLEGPGGPYDLGGPGGPGGPGDLGGLGGPGGPVDLHGLVMLIEMIRVLGWSGWSR